MSNKQSLTFFLADNENVHIRAQDIEELASDPEFHFRVFIGATQNKLETDLVMAVQSLGERGQFIHMRETGKNALDFFLVYTVGQLSVRYPGASFCILSSDRDYDPLIRHLRAEGILIKRQSIRKEHSGNQPSSLMPGITDMLRKASSARPKSVTALCNWLRAKMPDYSDQELHSAIRSMEQSNVITISENKVKYRI
ncbi:PIN domain-containing protein [Oceanospirillum beijerinckii]|uniref:PIN domain-containing protein n=1 Tax=Oceanospirillum beijerinckii TaxID=64976 RepID=UPI000683E642|nr:PIN domain-containing protein [Oceanospirillum beijerinckii]